MIRIENLSKSFGTLKVLENINMTIEKGERIVLIGQSGCGKSVFLRTLELLEKPDSGRIFIGDNEITAQGANVDAIRQGMGMVYQGFHLFEHMNVLENIILAPVKLKKIPRAIAIEQAIELLRMVGLEGKIYAMPAVLSGGQKQRIAICRCLAMEPAVMLFDEPTSALDPTMIGEVLATIRMLTKRDMTMLIVTHEMEFAREVATRVLYFDDHGVYEEGSPTALFDNPQKPKTQAFVRKLKYFEQQIHSRYFDLMQLHGGIRAFTEKYNLDKQYAGRLQLCTEELIYELLDGAVPQKATVDMTVSIAYSESEKSVSLCVRCVGQPYNPFDESIDTQAHLGVMILKSAAKEIAVSYTDGANHISITL